MKLRGRLKPGAIADVTIFDPATVTDNSSIETGKNSLPSTGIPYVIVNGTVVVKDSKVLKGVYPGQPIRNAVLN
ncbi:MAG: hydrolase, partial [Chromatiales bacterium]|nr:hydrolase [Chromatiales bacterium]